MKGTDHVRAAPLRLCPTAGTFYSVAEFTSTKECTLSDLEGIILPQKV